MPARRSVGSSVGNAFVKIDEKWTFTDFKLFVKTVLDEEKRGSRRKEARRARKKVVKKK